MQWVKGLKNQGNNTVKSGLIDRRRNLPFVTFCPLERKAGSIRVLVLFSRGMHNN